ncbi:hypothetical protein [Siphonobacter aquaeclarae]|uniref:HTH luxR-type domain-containing protein n=1 Tax=Siphonobacter aquaeclarae TaxID=563176 RepID=A0A1G9W2T8_9BACT|nr:hypothetical protein [Siphonobacter aquaeclarae]SDM78385.1 hypothetical protein SAMN04488090_4220 [Siphonobacter aquaeclarae]
MKTSDWKRTLLTGLVALLSAGPLLAFQGALGKMCLPEVVHFTPADYKAQRQNWSLVQDPKTRFLYAGNSKGLLEFDGRKWQVYTLPRRQIVRSVAVADGKIFTGALQEFGFWQADSQGVLRYHSLAGQIQDKRFRNEEIWNILPVRDAVYFHSFAFLFRYKNNKITQIPTPGNVFFAYEVNNRLLIQFIDKGLFEWVGEKFVLLKGSEFLGKERIRCLLPLSGNRLLVGTDRLLLTYDGQQFTRMQSEAESFLSAYHLNKAIRVDDRTLAFGSILNGLILTDENGNILTHLNQKKGLQNNTVLALRRDADGNVWTGNDSGIDLVLLSLPLRYYQDQDGVLGTVYDAAVFRGKLYVGTNHGVFEVPLADRNAGFRLVPGSQGQVWDLAVIDGELFCGHNEGTFLIRDGTFQKISSVTGGLALIPLTRHPGVLLQGTYTHLCVYKKIDGAWQFSHVLSGDFSLTHQLAELADGSVWLKRKYGGLAEITLSDDVSKLTSVRTIDGFQDASLTSMEGRGILCAGGRSYEIRNRKIVPVSLFGEAPIRNIFPVGYQSYVVLKNNGALGYYRPDQPVQEVNLRHIQWVEGYENIVPLDDEQVLICRDDGFSVLPVSYLRKREDMPFTRPDIREIRTDQLEMELYPRQPLPNLALRHWQNDLSFRISSTQYEVIFAWQYWLEGSGKEQWSTWREDDYLKFSALPPGDYVLHLRSASSRDETVLPFRIHPPWYWNTWSQLIYTLLLIGLLYLVYRLYRRRIQTHQNRIRQKMQAELDEEQRRNAQVLVELRNEQLRKDVHRKSEELANSAMNLLHKNELLETLKQELEKLRKEMGTDRGAQQYRTLVQLIDRNLADEHSWELFEANFNDVHDHFFKKLLEMFPNLTPGDLKLAAYLRMNLSSKEIAQLLNITVRSVELKRYRLRGKLELATEQNLNEFLMKM